MSHSKPNGRITSPGELASMAGAVLLNKSTPSIPWHAFIAGGIRVTIDGKPTVVVFDPQHTTDVDEAVALFRLMMSVHIPKPGPLAWETVPESVQRHFKFVGPPSAPTATE